MNQTLSSAKRLRVWPIIFLPAILALFLILHFSVDVPLWDEWHVPGDMYQHIVEGATKYENFFSQTNESRPLFPKLIFVAVGFTLGWHVTIFMALSWLCVLLTFLILLKLLQSSTEEHPFMFLFIASLIGALLFSTSQWENQLWGIQLIVFIPPLCLALSLLLQSILKSYGLKAMACGLLTVISTYSFANGMVVWLLAFPFFRIWLTDEWKRSPRREKTKIISWTAAYLALALATISFYFWDYQSNGIHQFLSPLLAHPLLGLKYYMAWLGSPLRYEPQIRAAIIVGAVVLSLVFISLAMVSIKWKYSSGTDVLSSCYPWICLTAYGILSGLAITSGRMQLYGLGGALTSRHTSFSLWVSIGLVGILYTLWNYEKDRHRITANITFGIIIGLISILTVSSWILGYKDMRAASSRSRQNLLTLRLLDVAPSNPLLNRLYIDPDLVRRRAKFLIQHGMLNIDEIGNWLMEKVKAPDGQDAGWFSVINSENENKISVTGWAMLPGKRVPADFVVLAEKYPSGNIEIVTGLANTIERPDVVEEKHNSKLILSGFEDKLDNIYADGNQFLMFAVDLHNRRLYELKQKR
jgi:hypothetical protein